MCVGHSHFRLAALGLSEIARIDGMSVNTLSKRMALHKTTASNIVNALVERKLIRRTRGKADQRVVQLNISVLGQRVLEDAPGPHAGLLVEALRRLELGELEGLQKSLAILVAEMDSMTRRLPARRCWVSSTQ